MRRKIVILKRAQWRPTTLLIKGLENLIHEDTEEIEEIERRLLTDL